MTSTTPFRRRGLLAACALAPLLGLAGPAPVLADARLVRVDVVDRDGGETLHVWRDHGRPVVAGRPGARYAVRLSNASGGRVLAVVAIDGVNVVTGETAGVDQRGYVLAPWQTMEITGWRKSDDEVAAFEFTALPDSYAARTGRPRDVGVIGVAVFREAGVPAVQEPRPARPKAAPAADAELRRVPTEPPAERAAVAPAPQERLGTGHGERETSVVRETRFERATARPEQQLAIRYDSLANLVAAGVVPAPRVAQDGAPRPFPADPARGFVPDPPRR